MLNDIDDAFYEYSKTINGYKFRIKPASIGSKFSSRTVTLEIDFRDSRGNLIETKSFTGTFEATVNDIKQLFQEDIDIILNDENRRHILSSTEKPLYRCFALYEGEIRQRPDVFLIAKKKAFYFQELTVFVSKCLYLRKLSIKSLPVLEISLKPLYFLKYVEIVNAGLRKLTSTVKTIEFCNLSNNGLEKCDIHSKVLILENNRIRSFNMSFRFKYLNISNNPLRDIKCSCEFLNIRNTDIKGVLGTDAKIILADGIKNFRIGTCPNLESLSVNNCDLKDISRVVRKLKIFKARNNYFQNLPKMENCSIIDVSGNFLETIKSKNATFLNVSKNQFREFDFRKFPLIKHLNISFNPLEKVIKNNENEKTIIMNDLLIINNSFSTAITGRSHVCTKVKKNGYLYKLESTIENTRVFVNIVVVTDSDKNYSANFAEWFDQFRSKNSIIDIFVQFSDYCYRKLLSDSIKTRLTVILITRKIVMARTFGLPLFIMDFSEAFVLKNSNDFQIFNNVSSWYAFPILCPCEDISIKRVYSLFSNKVTIAEIFQFSEFLCGRSLEFLAFNQQVFHSNYTTRTITKCDLKKVVEMNDSKKDFSKALINAVYEQETDVQEILGLSNIDFNLNITTAEPISNSIITTTPVFLFLKINFTSNTNYVIEAEELNIINLLEFYCKALGGVVVEKNYAVFIIAFNKAIQAAIFALKIENALNIHNIEINAGITGDLIFRSEEEGIIYFGGPVLNKASRIANCGFGVFACDSIKLNFDIIDINDESDRYLKGFEARCKIQSLKLNTKQKMCKLNI